MLLLNLVTFTVLESTPHKHSNMNSVERAEDIDIMNSTAIKQHFTAMDHGRWFSYMSYHIRKKPIILLVLSF